MSVDHTKIIGIKISKTKSVRNVLLYHYLKYPCVLECFHMALFKTFHFLWSPTGIYDLHI